MEKVQHTCSTSSLHIIRTLNIKNTDYYMAKRFDLNLLIRITTLRFHDAIRLDYSLVEYDARCLMIEPFAHLERMMVLAEAKAEDRPHFPHASLYHRVQTCKVKLEDSGGSTGFETELLPAEDHTGEDPRQVIMDYMADLPGRYGRMAVDLQSVDDEFFYHVNCAMILGQLCGILSTWPPELQYLNELATYFGRLVQTAIAADDGELDDAEGDDEGYRSN
ncbi:unnamed protein product [Clonostachys rosea f. rosea IK726]|uniref:Uncharacterized protein n=1 Tax=Clonostachys rosea f. rosea IK726 TaxID=1349383 RepID=A0ACA9UBR0_BIOOC|nr:unnamed protein product [Clonostachys rosea f. rosea IK726]